MKRICVVAPGKLGSIPRVVKEADALFEFGYEVRVVAADMVPWVRWSLRSLRHRPPHVK